MRWSYLVAGALLGTAAVLGAGFLFSMKNAAFSEDASAGQERPSASSEEYRRLAGLIDIFGPAQAHEEFKREYEGRPFHIQHPAAHLWGELIYQKFGLEGIAHCDEAFAFGCYHSFFAEAIVREGGMESIPQLDEICKEKHGTFGGGCQHGIGHGIIQYLGHQRLKEALEACALVHQSNKLFGCTAGVFMEFLTPVTITEEGAYQYSRKEFDASNPHAPCDAEAVAERFRPACYYQLALWWHQELEGDEVRMGELCGAISASEERQACYRGAGNVIVSGSEYDVAASLRMCGAMPDEEGELICKIGAAERFQGYGEEELAQEICETIEKENAPFSTPCNGEA